MPRAFRIYDNHLTGCSGAGGDHLPAGLGRGCLGAGRFRGTPTPTPPSRREWRKNGRPLSASPLVGPTHIPDHHQQHHPPHTRKKGYTLFVF